jgi:NADPH-dependent 2,4-dienoyl-CoA reductase/sulfur reductase-like enzyme
MGDGVLIVGGGLAAQRCVETLRRGGYEGRLRIVCGEDHAPYDRPPLSKESLALEAEQVAPSFRPASWYDEHEVELILGVRAASLDGAAHVVKLSDGTALDYDQLVIATGARPRTLPLLHGYRNVSTLRTVEDSALLRRLFEERRRLVVIGAGFIGQEVAAAARAADAPVTVIEIESFPLVALLGPQMGEWFARLHTGHGVELILGAHVKAVRGDDRIETLTLAGGRSIPCDHVLVGVGVRPDVEWLESAGIPASGVPIDAAGRTPLPAVYAAGDAAAAFDPVLERHALSGHWEAASRQGVQVAHTILGREPSAPAPSSFWSDQYGLRIQYLGHAQLADSITIEGDPAENDFVASYSRGGELVAALVVGRPRAVAELRQRLSPTTERTPA